MPLDDTREQHRMAAYLPRPLYVLYMQASAFRDACGESKKYIIHKKQMQSLLILRNNTKRSGNIMTSTRLLDLCRPASSSEVHCFNNISDKKLSVSIHGDADVARAMLNSSDDPGITLKAF